MIPVVSPIVPRKAMLTWRAPGINIALTDPNQSCGNLHWHKNLLTIKVKCCQLGSMLMLGLVVTLYIHWIESRLQKYSCYKLLITSNTRICLSAITLDRLCWPLSDHLVTSWWPLGNHLGTTSCPLGVHLVNTWWLLGEHLGTTLVTYTGV